MTYETPVRDIYTSPHSSFEIILFILIQLLLNIFTILKWIIAYCPIYIGCLHSEPVGSPQWYQSLFLILAFGHQTFGQKTLLPLTTSLATIGHSIINQSFSELSGL